MLTANRTNENAAATPRTTPLFPLGRLEATARALAALDESDETIDQLLARHRIGDWGVVCAEDWAMNDRDVHAGYRLHSAYRLSTGVKVWVMTESNRMLTTVLLPDEY